MLPHGEIEPRYLFRAHAVPLCGRIRRPADLVIPSQAATTVGVAGGRAEAILGPQSIGEIFHFKAAVSHVDADYADPARAVRFTYGNYAQNLLPTRTVTYCAVKGLKIVVRGTNTERHLSIDNLELQLTSRGRISGMRGNAITIDHAILGGVTLDGHRLDIELRYDIFSQYDTIDKLREVFTSSDTFFKEHGHMFLYPSFRAGTSAAWKRKIPQAGGMIAGTLVGSVRWARNAHPQAIVKGHRVYFRDFGVLHFGEVALTNVSRRVTLIRIQFGSPHGGEASIADAEASGFEWPTSGDALAFAEERSSYYVREWPALPGEHPVRTRGDEPFPIAIGEPETPMDSAGNPPNTEAPEHPDFYLKLEGSHAAGNQVVFGTDFDLVFDYNALPAGALASLHGEKLERVRDMNGTLGIAVFLTGCELRDDSTQFSMAMFKAGKLTDPVRFRLRAGPTGINEARIDIVFSVKGARIYSLPVRIELVDQVNPDAVAFPPIAIDLDEIRSSERKPRDVQIIIDDGNRGWNVTFVQRGTAGPAINIPGLSAASLQTELRPIQALLEHVGTHPLWHKLTADLKPPTNETAVRMLMGHILAAGWQLYHLLVYCL